VCVCDVFFFFKAHHTALAPIDHEKAPQNDLQLSREESLWISHAVWTFLFSDLF